MSDTLDTRDTWDSESLSRLDLSGNGMGNWNASPDAMTALGASLVACGTVVDLNISKNKLNAKDIAGFAGHLQDMGSLASLDISNNSIGSAQEAIIKQICAGRSIKCAL